jgi:hypothetical protein
VEHLEAFGLEMAERRAAGADFDTAWAQARDRIPRGTREDRTLRLALLDTREAWERAWAGEPVTAGERAAAALVGLLDAAEVVVDEDHRELVA